MNHESSPLGWLEISKAMENQRDAARKRVYELETAIRLHRDQRGDDRCWMDDELLYSILPEGYTPPGRDSRVELSLCEKFIKCRHNPGTVYVSPQRKIEELEAEIETLKLEKRLAELLGENTEWMRRNERNEHYEEIAKTQDKLKELRGEK